MKTILGPATILFLIGILSIAFRKPFAALIIRKQNEGCGFHFGKKTEKITEIIILIIGSISLLSCILCIFSLI